MALGETVRRETPIRQYDGVRAISGPAFPTRIVKDSITEVALPPSWRWGQPTEGDWKQIREEEIQTGDKLRITYRMLVPFFTDWQRDYIVRQLVTSDRFNLRHVAMNEEERRLVVEVEVLKPQSPALLIPIVIVALLAGGLIWLSTVSIERLGTVEIPGLPPIKMPAVLVLAALSLLGLAFWRKLRS